MHVRPVLRSSTFRFRYPRSEPTEVARISEYAAAKHGYGPLHDELRDWLRSADEPGNLHRFFASLPAILRERGVPHQLLVTTSYGTALEQAFADAGDTPLEPMMAVFTAPARMRVPTSTTNP